MNPANRIKEVVSKLNLVFKKIGIVFKPSSVPVVDENVTKVSVDINGNDVDLEVDSEGNVNLKDFTSSTLLGNINSPAELANGMKSEFEKKEILEMSSTGTGSSFSSGTGEQFATKFAFKKKRKNIKESVSYTDEQVSKFIDQYESGKNKLKADLSRNVNLLMSLMVEDIFENYEKVENIKKEIEKISDLTQKIYDKFEDIRMDMYDADNTDSDLYKKLEKIVNSTDKIHSYSEVFLKIIENILNMTDKEKTSDIMKTYKKLSSETNLKENQVVKLIDKIILSEISYHKFKKDTKNRTNPEQLNRAVKEIKKRILEINKIVDFTQRLKEELHEDKDLIKWKATENALAKIGEAVNQLNNKIKNLNQ